LTFGGLFFATGFVVTLPAVATLGALHGLGVTAWWGRFPAVAVFLFGLPGLVAGITMLRRSVWLWRIKGQVEHLPTSTVRGAALGLVELKGVASAEADGVGTGAPLITRKHGSYHTAPFFLEDDTGRVRVIPPEGHFRGEDERITLTRRAVAQGAMVEATLLTGDPVYVLGNLETAAGGPEGDGRVVRPMKTPYARLLDTQVMGALPVASFLSSFLGLGFVQHADFFLLTDASEADAKSRFCRQWRRTLAWGLVWVAVSLPLANWGLRGIVEPGSAGLLRAVERR